MKTVKWSVKNMPLGTKNRIKAFAAEAQITIPEALDILSRQTKRAEFIQLSRLRKAKK